MADPILKCYLTFSLKNEMELFLFHQDYEIILKNLPKNEVMKVVNMVTKSVLLVWKIFFIELKSNMVPTAAIMTAARLAAGIQLKIT